VGRFEHIGIILRSCSEHPQEGHVTGRNMLLDTVQ